MVKENAQAQALVVKAQEIQCWGEREVIERMPKRALRECVSCFRFGEAKRLLTLQNSPFSNPLHNRTISF